VDRDKLVDFCVEATAELHGVDTYVVDRKQFEVLTDEQLKREADWLDDMLGK
jgi:hypothetical protein